MKRRFVWAALAALVLSVSILSGMRIFAAQGEKGERLWLVTEQGEPDALADVVVSGGLFDETHSVRYSIEEGQISTQIEPRITREQFRAYQRSAYWYSNPSWYDAQTDSDVTLANDLGIYWFPPTAKVEEQNKLIQEFKDGTRTVTRVLKSDQICTTETVHKNGKSILMLPAYYIEMPGIRFFRLESYYTETGERFEHRESQEGRDWAIEHSNKSDNKLCQLNGDYYYITTTNSNYRGYGSICRLENWDAYAFMQWEDDQRYARYDPLDLERLKELDAHQGYTRLYNIDLEEGKRCIYGMSVLDEKLAVLTYTQEGAPEGMANYALWLFDVARNQFVCKQEVGSFPLKDYQVDLFPQEDAITLCFYSKTQKEPAQLLTVVHQEGRLRPLNRLKLERPRPAIPTEVRGVWYRDGKTYLYQIISDLERPENEEEPGGDYRPDALPSLLISVFEGERLCYTGRLEGDYQEDYAVTGRLSTNIQVRRSFSPVAFAAKEEQP